MNDDWRLQVDLDDPNHVGPLVERLEARELEHDLSNAFHDRVIVSRDGPRVFLYAGSRAQAEAARELLLSLAQQHGWKLEVDLKHWHPEAEDWEDPDKPLPANDAAKRTEHEALMAAERRETEERGYPEFEVRVDLPSRHDAVQFADTLRNEGLPVVHRWKFLLIGVTDEDTARPSPSDSETRPRPVARSASREPGRPPTPSARQTHSQYLVGWAARRLIPRSGGELGKGPARPPEPAIDPDTRRERQEL